MSATTMTTMLMVEMLLLLLLLLLMMMMTTTTMMMMMRGRRRMDILVFHRCTLFHLMQALVGSENDFTRYWIPNTGLQTKEEGPEKEAGNRLTTGIVLGGGGGGY